MILQSALIDSLQSLVYLYLMHDIYEYIYTIEMKKGLNKQIIWKF